MNNRNLYNAFKSINQQYGPKVFEDNFKLRCLASDIIKNDYYAKNILNVIYKVNCETNIYQLLISEGLISARKILSQLYIDKFSEEFSQKIFVESVNLISLVACHDEYLTWLKRKNDIETETPKEVENVPKDPTVSFLDTVSIDIDVHNLKIMYSDDKTIKLRESTLEEKDKIEKFVLDGNDLNLTIGNSKNDYVLMLPKIKIKKLVIKAQKSNVYFIDKLKTDCIIFSQEKNESKIWADCIDLNIYTLNTNTTYNGYFRRMNYYGISGNFSFNLNFKTRSPKSHHFINCNTKNGLVDLNFDTYPIKPMINIPFLRTSCYQGDIKAKDHTITLKLESESRSFRNKRKVLFE